METDAMIKILLFVLLLASPLYAGKKYGYQDPKLDDEMDNNYKEHQFPNWVYAQGSSMTVRWASISSGTATAFNVVNSTITNLTVSGVFSGVTLGKLRQTKKCESTTSFNTTSAAFQTANLTCSITPLSANNSIIIIAIATWGASGAISRFATIARGTTNLSSDVDGYIRDNTGNILDTSAMVTIDAPNTTSSTTYNVRVHADGANSVTYGNNTLPQIMVLLEVAP